MANAPVDTTHPAYDQMLPAWELVDDLMGGTQAMKAAGTKWLPQEDGESSDAYESRLADPSSTMDTPRRSRNCPGVRSPGR